MKKEEYQRIFELEESHWWYLGMKNISQSLLLPVVSKSKNQKILDAGCGTGGTLVFLKGICQVYGIDLSPLALKFCRKRGLKQVRRASIEKIPYEDNSFDVVTCFDVLYHQWVKDDLAALKEFYRILKPRGYLLLRVPAYNWLRRRHDQIVATRHRYSRGELNEKLKTIGLTILRSTYANMILFPLAVTKRYFEKVLPESQSSDIIHPPPIINSLLVKTLYLEALLISKFDLPFGLSLFVLAQKPF